MELSQEEARNILREHKVDIAPDDPRSAEDIALQLLEHGTSTLISSLVITKPIESISIDI